MLETVMKTHTPEARAKAEKTKRAKRQKYSAEQASREYREAHGLSSPPAGAPHEERSAHQRHSAGSTVSENLSWAHRAPLCKRWAQKNSAYSSIQSWASHRRLLHSTASTSLCSSSSSTVCSLPVVSPRSARYLHGLVWRLYVDPRQQSASRRLVR